MAELVLATKAALGGKQDVSIYAVCATAAATAAKTVDLAGFALVTGARVQVKFSNTNSAAGPTLNVNSTGAKAVYYNGAAITAGYLKTNRVYEFVYNGAQWEFMGDVNVDTTYSAMTAAEATAGTATTARSISAKVLNDKIDEKVNAALTGADQSAAVAEINAKIPSAATASNQLADKAFVNSSIQTERANHVYYNAAMANFPTRAALTAATQFYNAAGAAYTPTVNDYTFVAADEGLAAPDTGDMSQWKFNGSQWAFDVVFNNTTFTASQLAAMDSGITAAKVTTYDGYAAGKQDAQVTFAAPAASATQTTAGTRTIAAQLKILIDNIAKLFSYFTGDKANKAAAADTAAALTAAQGTGTVSFYINADGEPVMVTN